MNRPSPSGASAWAITEDVVCWGSFLAVLGAIVRFLAVGVPS